MYTETHLHANNYTQVVYNVILTITLVDVCEDLGPTQIYLAPIYIWVVH